MTSRTASTTASATACAKTCAKNMCTDERNNVCNDMSKNG